MSGKDDAGFDLDDLDWDAALNEWEQKTFVPEVAQDKETRTAALPMAPASTKMPSATPLPLPVEPVPAAAGEASAAAVHTDPDEVATNVLAPVAPAAPVARASSAAPAASVPPTIESTNDLTNEPTTAMIPSVAPRATTLSANPPRIVPRAGGAPRASHAPLPKVSNPPRPVSSPSLPGPKPSQAPQGAPAAQALPQSTAPRVMLAEPPTRVAALLPSGELAKAPGAPAPVAVPVAVPGPVVGQDLAGSLRQLTGSEDDAENTALFGRIFREDATANTEEKPAPAATALEMALTGATVEIDAAGAGPSHAKTDEVARADAEHPASEGEMEIVASGDDDDLGDEYDHEHDDLARTAEHRAEHPQEEQQEHESSDAPPDRSDGSRPSIHMPPQRAHDPDAVTNMVVLEELFRSGDPEDSPTRLRVQTALAAGSEGELGELRPAPVFEDEKPASEYLDDAARAKMAERARRIETEARTRRDPRERARGLLVASELFAMIGKPVDAQERAAEAREIAPTMSLAHVQARTLGWADRSEAVRVTELDAEARSATTLAGQVHALLLNADLLRAQGDEEAAVERWDQAMRAMPDDVRAPVARAARALSRADLTAAAALEAALPTALGGALATALRLRGHDEERVGDIPANDSLRRARAAFERHEIEAASARIAEIRSVPELASAATWLASMVAATSAGSRAESAQLLKPLAFKGDAEARRALAARTVELGDTKLADELLSEPEPFAPAEWSVLSFLLGLSGSTNQLLDNVTEASPALGAALAAASLPGSDEDPREARHARALRTAGEPVARKLVTLGRMLADRAPAEDLAAAIFALGHDAPESVRTVGLELSLRAGRVEEVAEALRTWLAEDETAASARDRQLAAALVAESSPAGDRTAAIVAYRAALQADRSDTASLRALFALDSDALTEAARSLVLAAEERTGTFAAAARIEAAARVTNDESRRLLILSDAHRAAPELALGAMLAERAARAANDPAAVSQWIGEQRDVATDPLERALLDVRHAFAAGQAGVRMTENDRAQASTRLAEAHRAFPSDVALRELHERFAEEPPMDRAAWSESRGAAAIGPSRVLYFLEAAHEYERAGDTEAALRAARAAADGGDEGLARLALERAEEAAGDVTRRVESLTKLHAASEGRDTRDRVEAMERLADLESSGRNDLRASLEWHRRILEISPDYLASLRAMEHGLISLDRDGAEDQELGTIAAAIARVTSAGSPFEASSHAQLAVRLHLKHGHPWDETRDITELAASLPEPALWALRLADAHARALQDEAWQVTTTQALLERTNQPAEAAFLNVRAGEASLRLQRAAEAAPFFERATAEDAGDIVAWGRLAEVRRRTGNLEAAGDALESLARTSLVADHQRAAWVAAAVVWLDDLKDEARGVVALEQAATVDLGTDEVFDRLVSLYTRRGQRQELAELLERRLATVTDAKPRALLQVQRGRALAEVGDLVAAASALESALELDADNLAALQSHAEVAMKRSDWNAAEQSLVRLARLVAEPEEQGIIYGVLGDLYADRLGNLSRAETAMREVLKRSPEDVKTLEKLAGVYKKQKDAAQAIEIQTQLVALAKDPAMRRQRMLEMAQMHDVVAGDARRAEQVLEAARKESPLDVGVLRALVEFYERHKQGPAVKMLLDRVGGDARRAITAGRVVPAQLEQLATVYELRGRADAAAVVAGSLRALRNEPADVRGADGRAFSADLDDLLAPELLSPSLRALLARAGDALDVASPVDLRSYRAVALPAPAAGLGQAITQLASSGGITQVQVLVSPAVAMTMVPATSAPATILIGESLLAEADGSPAARLFLAARALKATHAHASALMRTPAAELNVLISAWLNLFNPSWRPESIPAAALGEAARKIKAGLPRQLPPDLSFAALEVAGALGPQMDQLGPVMVTWANRVALLAVGDLGGAFDAIAWSSGAKGGAPTAPAERAAWVASNPEARDLLAFSVGDAYAEARSKLRLG